MFYMVFTISIPNEIEEQMKPFLIKIRALNCNMEMPQKFNPRGISFE